MYVCCMHRPVCLRAQPFKLFNNNVSMQPRRCFFGLFFIVGFFHHFSLELMSLSALFAFFPFSLYLFRSFTLCASFVAFLVCARRALSSYIVLLLLFHTIFLYISQFDILCLLPIHVRLLYALLCASFWFKKSSISDYYYRGTAHEH